MKKLILILSLCFISDIVFAINRSVIRNQIRYMLQDATSTITTQDFAWSTELLNERINIVQEKIVCYRYRR